MDSDTAAPLLPALLLVVPLILAILDFFAIGRVTPDNRPQPAQVGPTGRPRA
jgi:hypothetical protein